MTRSHETPKSIHTPAPIHVTRQQIAGEPIVELRIGHHDRKHLTPQEALETAIRLIMSAELDYIQAGIIEKNGKRQVKITWRPNSFELRQLVERIEGR